MQAWQRDWRHLRYLGLVVKLVYDAGDENGTEEAKELRLLLVFLALSSNSFQPTHIKAVSSPAPPR